MALQSLQITAITAMRARDVSRPSRDQQEAADRRPLRDETPRKEPARNGGNGGRREPSRGEPAPRERHR
ncbi:hypothetical protein ACSDR0_00060 [Streptosporangium sp. G11]|uniref:hypothetical protein n=1 Tax=Streptosporangium sp. G11 TaxID=3436926 RepID=UPI003EBF7CB4